MASRRVWRWVGPAAACAIVVIGGTPCAAQSGALVNGRVLAEPADDSLFVARWSAAYAGGTWRLDIGPNRRFRLWRAGGPGDTLIASMGEWALRGVIVGNPARTPESGARRPGVPTQHFCVRPDGGAWMCSRIVLDDLGYPHGVRWLFVESDSNAMSWAAYREGRAPWELEADPDAEARAVYELNEVSDRPRLRRCPVVPQLPSGVEGPVRVMARLVVEPDSTPSDIEILDALLPAVRARAMETMRSCRFVPGRLEGVPVRVRVQFPFDFQ